MKRADADLDALLQRPPETFAFQHGLAEDDLQGGSPVASQRRTIWNLASRRPPREYRFVGPACAVQQLGPLAQPHAQDATDLVRLVACQDDRVAGEGVGWDEEAVHRVGRLVDW